MMARDVKPGDVIVRLKHSVYGWIGPDTKVANWQGLLPARLAPVGWCYFDPIDAKRGRFSLYPDEEVELQTSEVATEEIEIDSADVKVGDVVTKYRNKDGGRWYGPEDNPDMPVEIREISPQWGRMTAGGWALGADRTGQHTRNFTIGQWAFMVRSPASARVKSASHWNGTCRCGKRTYTGFLQIEHEGGPCSG